MSVSTATVSQVSDETLDLVIFQVAGQRYGLPAADVREILPAVTITVLPQAPRIVEGIINRRGQIVPVFDIRGRFRLPAKPLTYTDHLIVADIGRLVALRVDRTLDLTTVDAETIAETEETLPEAEYVAGVAKLADGLVLIHDLRTFLTEAEAEELDDAVQAEEAELEAMHAAMAEMDAPLPATVADPTDTEDDEDDRLDG
jgi:purine-binding chemotaxis protein CheW